MKLVDTFLVGALVACSAACAVDDEEAGPDAGLDQAEVEDATGTFRCAGPDGPATTIRNTPSGFVIGNCLNGTTLKRAKKSEAAGFWWDGGYIFGNFEGYGWVRSDGDTQVDGSANGYTGASTSISDIASLVSCPYGESCGDGAAVTLRGSCPTYANKGGHDQLGGLGAGTALHWRYRTLDGAWAMVRVDGVKCSHAGTGENHALGWRFVPSSCIDYPAPSGRCVVDRWNNPVYCSWRQFPGLAVDVGVGANGTAWVIGTNSMQGGYGIYRWNGSGWDGIPGAAVRIAVGPNGNAWVVNSWGQIFRWTGSTWQQLPGGALDIGVGADGTAWVIGTNSMPGGHGIYRWNGSNWDAIPGAAERVAVGPNGNAWVVNAYGQIFRWTGSTWQLLPGGATDIGVSASGQAYVIGTDSTAGGHGIYRWNGSNWDRLGGAATVVAGGAGNFPWVVNSAGAIFYGGP